MLSEKIRPQGYWYQGPKEEVHWMEVLTCQGYCCRIIVMVLVEVWVEVAGVCQPMEEVERKVLTEEEEHEGPEELDWIRNFFEFKTERFLPITKVKIQINQSRNSDHIVKED